MKDAGRVRVLRIPLTLTTLLALFLGLAAARGNDGVVKIPDSRLEPVAWSSLSGWGKDDHAAAFDAFLASCRPITAGAPPRAKVHSIAAALREVCARALVLGPARANEARDFFEAEFTPVRIARLAETEGFLTGYYEPVVSGSRQPTREYTVPIYRRPGDLISGARRSGPGFPNKGGAWRRVGKKRVPYHDRAAIEDGALDGKGLEICWLKDPVDAFFMQIQGSARVQLEDGAILRLNYAAHNGHPYTPVGKILIDRGEVPKDEMSMDRIRQWMEAHPEQGKELRRQNRSFVFFRVADLAGHEEAVGGQGIPLTSGRSIAIDRKLHIYGTPFWIEGQLPLESEASLAPFRRLMIAQDTGSAIIGPARADIYFGAGEAAGRVAGRIRHPATFVMLVPRAAALTDIQQPVPLPRPRPQA